MCTWSRTHASAVGAARGSVGGSSKSPWPAPGKTMIVQSLLRCCLIDRSRATLWSGGTLRSSPPKSHRAGMSRCSRYGVGSKPDGFHEGSCRSSSSGLRTVGGFLLEARDEAVLEDAWAGERDERDVRRLLCRARCDPAGCAGADEANLGAVHSRRGADGLDRADRVGGDEVEVAMLVRAAAAL